MAPVGQTVVAQRRATRGQRGPYVWVGAQSVGGIRHLTPYKLGGMWGTSSARCFPECRGIIPLSTTTWDSSQCCELSPLEPTVSRWKRYPRSTAGPVSGPPGATPLKQPKSELLVADCAGCPGTAMGDKSMVLWVQAHFYLP